MGWRRTCKHAGALRDRACLSGGQCAGRAACGPALTAEEQSRAVAELIAARDRAAAQAKAAHRDEDIAEDEGLATARGKYAGDAAPRNN